MVPKNSKHEKKYGGLRNAIVETCARAHTYTHIHTHTHTHTHNEERIGLNFFCILENSLTKTTNEN